jgi:predicted secreted Zn-dependent protease
MNLFEPRCPVCGRDNTQVPVNVVFGGRRHCRDCKRVNETFLEAVKAHEESKAALALFNDRSPVGCEDA